MVLTTAKTVIFFRKPSSSVFSVKSHWIKTQISGMVELGVLMKFHYRKSFDNPVVVSEGECKVGKNSKVGSKDGFAI
jgi:hypothetical protein